MAGNAGGATADAGQPPYFDWLLQFQPMLSPVNRLPSPQELDQTWEWGWEQMDRALPLVANALQRIPAGIL